MESPPGKESSKCQVRYGHAGFARTRRTIGTGTNVAVDEDTERDMPWQTLTTAASSPTVCNTVNSLVRIVGIIHPKNLELPLECMSVECALAGEKSGVSTTRYAVRPHSGIRNDGLVPGLASMVVICTGRFRFEPDHVLRDSCPSSTLKPLASPQSPHNNEPSRFPSRPASRT
jgi:hypothetical protein